MIRDFSQETVDALYETIRTNIEEEEQWKPSIRYTKT